MTASQTACKDLIQQYIDALNGKPKTTAIVERFVSDPVLAEHILATEAGFPAYEILVDQLIAEEDTVALRGTFRGVHRGHFAGIAPTGRQVSAPMMIFYRLADDRIAEHWLQIDGAAIVYQLTAA